MRTVFLAAGAVLAALAVLADVPGAARAQDSVPQVPAGRPATRLFGSEQGLPHSTVRFLVPDARGFIWAGTQDGAAVYNGRRWRAVEMPQALGSNYVHTLLPASDGSLWFGGDAGLARLHDGRWSMFRFHSQPERPDNFIWSLAEERDGPRTVIWAGTSNGLARWDGKVWSVIDPRTFGFSDPRITAVLVLPTPEGPVLWVGGYSGIARRAQGRWTRFGPETGFPEGRVSAIRTTGSEAPLTVWAGIDSAGVARYDGERWAVEKVGQGRVLSLAAPEAGEELWAGTTEGLAHRVGGRWIVESADSAGLPSDRIISLLISRRGGRHLLWIGMGTGGVAVRQFNGWRTLDLRNSGLPRAQAFGMAEGGPPGRPVFWFSPLNRGLMRWQAGTWSQLWAGTPIEHAEINTVLPTGGPDRPALLVGTTIGLFRWQEDGRKGRWTSGEEIAAGLPAGDVISLLETQGPAGPVLWVGTRAGLVRCDVGGSGERCRTLTPESSGLPDRQVYALLETWEAEGPVLWVGTRERGLARLAAGRWTTFDSSNSPLPDNWVNSLVETREGGRRFLWIGTDGGAVRLDLPVAQPRWLVLNDIDTRPRLPNNIVYQIRQDAQERLYLTTNKGVARLTARPAAEPGKSGEYDLYTFTTRDGLPADECNQWASMVDRSGRVWIGAGAGVAWLDPAIPDPQPEPSPMYVERIAVEGRELRFTGAPLELAGSSTDSRRSRRPGRAIPRRAMGTCPRAPTASVSGDATRWASSPGRWRFLSSSPARPGGPAGPTWSTPSSPGSWSEAPCAGGSAS
jgi:ligand-binding sensor domain-containing protein